MKKAPVSFIKVYSQTLSKIVHRILYTRSHAIYFCQVFLVSSTTPQVSMYLQFQEEDLGTVVPRGWCLGQHHQHHLGTC